MIHRRLFIGGLLAAAVGPAIVRASSLMPVVATDWRHGMMAWLKSYPREPMLIIMNDAGQEVGRCSLIPGREVDGDACYRQGIGHGSMPFSGVTLQRSFP